MPDKTGLVKGVLSGKPRSIARAISLVENNEEGAQELLKGLFPHRGESLILGITGAPGSGKSTLVDQLIGELRAKRKKIGIVAVDPSSPFTGGAILGDRIRMMRHSTDPDVFIRSMATRGHLGGLAKATGEAISIFEAAGKDIILVETVGVGQDEVEVVKLADLILVILTPGAGDDIQIFKAGIMEIADIFVLNKADTPGANKIEIQLKAMLELGLKDKDLPPVVKTVATEGRGTEELVQAIFNLRAKKERADLAARRKKLIAWMLRDITQEKLYGLINRAVKDSEFERYVEKIFNRKIDPYTAADEIVARLTGKRLREKR
ncbi:MAG: methylmalonyl Co-A mutase-associated GTPase MeaB [Candidatus Aminicenantes bacterium]|nr:methylmalonyl Co-A mutase-associated GTPase MeaB [Candidatus Aminicenantes bacterium]